MADAPVWLGSAAAFIASAAMLLTRSALFARRFAASAAETFWIALAAAALQLGTISIGLSFVSAVTPALFLTAQLCLMALAWRVTRPRVRGCRPARVWAEARWL